ncbi:ATP-binding protein [Bacteroidales bacterium OttesenSCG-928-C19]|nr:ATP-binding protein [Bacteroidales bacterium OttesenSCG-928-C19]
MELTNDYKQKVVEHLMIARKNFDGVDTVFAKQYGINNSVFSRIRKGETEKLLSVTQWLTIGRKLGVVLNERKWNIAKTDVFAMIEEDVLFCKEYSKSRIFVDECEIGKTVAAKYLSRNLKNCFYVDASQATTKQRFIRLLARTIGLDETGKYLDVLDNIKQYLPLLEKPVVIIDEAGDLDFPAFTELKGLWNATENACAWYLIGADGLRSKIEKGIANKKVGFKEIFSRFSSNYSSIVPTEKHERQDFYRSLITSVLSVNTPKGKDISPIVTKCLIERNGKIGGLRRAESLLILNS